MEAQIQKPILVTLTAPTCGGKSYLYNYIRDVAKLPCLISTTTRAPRVGEVEGLDYFFISQEESERLEREEQFAELAIYNNVRYGVTKEEFNGKLGQGLAFLIVEPTGIEHYAKPATDAGALHHKVYVHTDPAVRLQRFRDRTNIDMLRSLTHLDPSIVERVMKELNTSLNRLTTMLTQEIHWGTMVKWDRTVFGTDEPEKNLQIILGDIENLRAKDKELATWHLNRS
jgi:guanylate kinase